MEPKVSYLPVNWKDMREADSGIPAHLLGSETHVAAVVGMALGKWLIPNNTPEFSADNWLSGDLRFPW
jgi:hypothetical protein